MRRSLRAVILACILTAACNGGDDASSETSTTVSDTSSTAESTADRRDDALQEGRPSVRQRPDGPDLPGLLDTSDESVPDDSAVRTGTLDNGLRYYVRFNDNPGAKAELRLAVKAGSVNEIGPSTGVAHFAEHMLFNGTERFPENELIDVLRSFGAAFGADINAYTSFDETVYSLTVPNAEESVALGLTVLEEWLSHATIDPEEVIAERGVVLDEWRVRTQSTAGRLFRVAEQLYLAGTPYAGRSPIGSDSAIEAMDDVELRQFYDGWYRPDNAAIVVVGDIDVGDVVNDIERVFGPATPRSTSMPERPETSFGLDLEPDFGLHVDPDQQTVDVEVTLPLPAVEGEGTAAARAELIDLMIYDALVRRLEGDVAAGLAPFDRVVRGGNGFVDGLDAPALYAFTDAERVDETLVALLEEYERAHRHGFEVGETDLSRATIRTLFDSRYEGRASTQDRVYADQYVEDFLSASGYPSIDDEYRLGTALLDAITPEALHERFRARWANSAPHVIISTPESDASRTPGRDEVLTLIGELADRGVERREPGRDLPGELMVRPDPVDPVAARSVVDQGTFLFDPVQVSYPNGVTVIVNSNKIVAGQLFFQASSPGGSSLVADGDVVDALYAADVVLASGVADFNQAEVAEILAGSDVSLDAWISPYRENLAGTAAVADAEALFQLIHLTMAQPRVDPVALGQVVRQTEPVVSDPGSDPGRAGDDALIDARYPGQMRYAVLPEPDDFATLDLDGIERVWSDRYGDAAGWVFVIIGDVDVDEILELAAAYLGTLPSTGILETPIDVEDPPPSDVVEVSVEAGTGDTAVVSLLFTSPVDDITARLRVNADVVTEVITARLSDVIREELGESYSPLAFTDVVTDPDPAIETFVRVTGSPDRVAAIADLVVGELADLAANGPDDQEFFNAFAQVEEAYGFVNNAEFINELLDDAVDPARELDDYLLADVELVSVTASTVQAYLRDHVPVDQYIQVTVVPRGGGR